MNNQYQLSKNNITFSFNYDPEIISSIKQIEGRGYISTTKEWIVPINISNNHQILQVIEKYHFEEKVAKNDYTGTQIELQDFSSKVKDLKLQRQPREYQNFAIDYMLTAKRVINGDSCGIGKTLSTVFSCEIGNLFPVLVITLSSVKYHWLQEWKDTNPNRSISVLESVSKNNNFDADVLIMSYGMLGNKIRLENKDGKKKYKYELKYDNLFNKQFKAITIDEVHKCQNPKTINSKITTRLSNNSEYVFGLTGTLINNKPKNLISPLNIIGRFNELFGSWNSFVYKYCDAFKDFYGFMNTDGASNTIELNQILRDNCYFRREKREVLKDLPELQTTVLTVEISNKREYKKAEDNIIDYLAENVSEIKADSAKMAEYLVMRTTLRQLTGKGKQKEVISWIENFLEETDEKLVVFGTYKETLQPLAKHFKSQLIDGSISSKDKARIIKEFQENKDRVLFGNSKALGTGTDGLQKVCSKLLQIEPSETPGEEDQIIGRVERSGAVSKDNKINFYKMLAINTIDVPMFEDLEQKREVTEAVNKGLKINAREFKDVVVNYFTSK